MKQNDILYIMTVCTLAIVIPILVIVGIKWAFRIARKSRLARTIFIFVPAILIIALIVAAITIPTSNEHKYRKQMQEYIITIPQLPASNEGAYIVGNLLIYDDSIGINIDEYKLYPMAVNRASSFENSSTLIVVACEGKKVGTYNGGYDAYQDICNLTIVDKTQNIVIGQESFLGPEPPIAITCRNGSCNNHGGLPFSEMKTYIQNLPIK